MIKKDYRQPADFIGGLFSLRAVLALWVSVSHLPFARLPFPTAFDKLSPMHLWTQRILFNGPAAVIVFFLISGLCIHWPQRKSLTVAGTEFLTRRIVRVGVPTLVALVLQFTVAEQLRIILWSLYVEIGFYFLYPALLSLRRRLGWMPLLLGSFGAAVALIYRMAGVWNLSFQAGGFIRTLVLAVPIFIAGCALAERLTVEAPHPSSARLWIMRSSALVLSTAINVTYRMGLVSLRVSLFTMAVLGFYWLETEIRYYRRSVPNRVLERMGISSFSLYLSHIVAFAVLFRFYPGPRYFYEPVALSLMFVASAIFYTLVEKPSHLLAIRLSRKVRPAPPEELKNAA